MSRALAGSKEGRVRRLLVIACALAILAAFPVGASADARAPERPVATAAGICDANLWSSGKVKKTTLTGRLNKAITIAERVDNAATIVSLVTGIVGTPASGAVVKLVAKLGKGAIVKVLKSTLKKVRGVPVKKGRGIGVKIRTKCKWGVVPYPTIAAYT